MTFATIDDDAWVELTHAATRALPRETGGLLLGYYIASQPHIARCLEIPDRAATAVRYRRDATVAAAMLRQTMAPYPEDTTGYIGEWHSHPAPVGPSDTDLLALRKLAEAGKHDVLMVVAAHTTEGWIGHARQAILEGSIQHLLLRATSQKKDHNNEFPY